MAVAGRAGRTTSEIGERRLALGAAARGRLEGSRGRGYRGAGPRYPFSHVVALFVISVPVNAWAGVGGRRPGLTASASFGSQSVIDEGADVPFEYRIAELIDLAGTIRLTTAASVWLVEPDRYLRMPRLEQPRRDAPPPLVDLCWHPHRGVWLIEGVDYLVARILPADRVHVYGIRTGDIVAIESLHPVEQLERFTAIIRELSEFREV